MGSVEREYILWVQKLSKHAAVPWKKHDEDAGYDLAACLQDDDTDETITIHPKGRAIVPTGLAITVPHGYYGRVAPRSGLAVKNGIDVGAGVIDCNYTGPVKVVLFNFGDEPFHIKHGDRIAQLLIERVLSPRILCVEQLPSTTRGGKGFGSSG